MRFATDWIRLFDTIKSANIVFVWSKNFIIPRFPIKISFLVVYHLFPLIRLMI